jgi:NADH:ubiquinone oxidoreductase subunit F (NADH-binding)
LGIPISTVNGVVSFYDSKGTKVFALAGQMNNTGLTETPMGTSLRTIIYDIGGGTRSQKV